MIKTPLSTVIGGAFWTPGATVISGNAPTFDQQIQKLFANGEQGFWYDPNELSTMYQDAAGTIPVTAAGQPVGLMLDKSNGLALGDDIKAETAPYIIGNAVPATFNPVTGFGTVSRIDALNQSYLTLALDAGKFYTMVINRPSGSGFLNLRLGTVGANVFVQIPPNTVTPVIFSGSAGAISFTASVGDISFSIKEVRELAGNPAYQTTSAARPVLRDAPRRIDFDAVDDKLITNLPAQLTGCTVIRSVPNVGTQILTGQTIPTTYEDNKDHCGLIVINRALTPSETSTIATEFNKRAGV